MKIAPSILSANFNHLHDDVKDLKKLGCDYLHVDVMDGHFVPNISFGTLAYENLKGKLDMIFDVHLMITNPLYYAPIFIKKGADILTFHLEVEQDKDEIIKVIKENGAKVGISIKPKTNVEELVPYLDKIDLILVMSVEPGFGGQKFMENSLPKIKFLDDYRKKHKLNYLIEVDGGINEKTAKLCKDNGCDIAVCGTYVFKAKDRKKAIEAILNL
jgi:ribulose-phosphate 3-epimerase